MLQEAGEGLGVLVGVGLVESGVSAAPEDFEVRGDAGVLLGGVAEGLDQGQGAEVVGVAVEQEQGAGELSGVVGAVVADARAQDQAEDAQGRGDEEDGREAASSEVAGEGFREASVSAVDDEARDKRADRGLGDGGEGGLSAHGGAEDDQRGGGRFFVELGDEGGEVVGFADADGGASGSGVGGAIAVSGQVDGDDAGGEGQERGDEREGLVARAGVSVGEEDGWALRLVAVELPGLGVVVAGEWEGAFLAGGVEVFGAGGLAAAQAPAEVFGGRMQRDVDDGRDAEGDDQQQREQEKRQQGEDVGQRSDHGRYDRGMSETPSPIPHRDAHLTPGRYDASLMEAAYAQAKKSYDEGGLPIGSVLADAAGTVLAAGHNRRVQDGDPTAHAEVVCIRNAGRRRDWPGLTLVSTLSPCVMCTGTSLLFRIGRVVIGEHENFRGAESLFEIAGVELINLRHRGCEALMRRFIAEHPELWHEDIGL